MKIQENVTLDFLQQIAVTEGISVWCGKAVEMNIPNYEINSDDVACVICVEGIDWRDKKYFIRLSDYCDDWRYYDNDYYLAYNDDEYAKAVYISKYLARMCEITITEELPNE